MGVLGSIQAWSARRRETANVRVSQALASGGEMSGKALTDATGMGPARLYPTLVEMEDRGDVSSRWVEGPSPRTRVYRLPAAA